MTRSPLPSRTALVTGAASGIGWETARLLAAQGCTVLVHARDAVSARDAVDRLVAAGADADRLEPVAADFTRLAEVEELARVTAAVHPVLDLLVNNAAVAAPERHTLTGDGLEISFQVNFLAAYLLTRRLAGPLTARPGSRVVNVSSSMHRTASIAWNDVNRARRYSRLAAYAQSQLALTVFTRAAVPADSNCTAVSVHPGICDTALLPLYAHEGDPAADGAAHVVRLCDPATDIRPGTYYDRTAPSPAAPVATDDRTVRRLCKLADRLVARAA
ncbi:SDR family NAD(P)-dependent oxidoreductase [Streptantibioticus cattleyicolor]|uniref:Short-chain dehydrogenase/reductase SDR n=1 Tax=Streptantibioticus cattleyicolor (strain ATCC 35852 / DSM 46488 / JCM 4925 / NBRC 14057 / NRRL 8057) TaxID=1003195 RepID=F8JJF9_STREN|nr:SDR family NAD(P)-dependent oxidoreductase [Streptantibioticus cattleyicolor]AEW98717.1 short-chain dehydrogenase/reductase SDR [Streptantibioticus cattleyicolor NRRL 8057 = DSM 46488]CCB72229.1 Short-chain dehydrogenase/reductase SDR [Streptantibioticus cattleyicolor NRRL 8057 = DSM 46488]